MRLRPVLSIGALAGMAIISAACSSDDDTITSDSITIDSITIDSATVDSITSDSLVERAADVRDALSDGDFSTMLELLELTGLAEELEGREVTVLAPSEAAFSDLTADELSELITDPSQADDLLRRHVLDDLYTYDELATLQEVSTLSGEPLAVTAEGGTVTVGGAEVTEPSADALAGEEGQEVAVFGIDRLLLVDQ